MAHSSGTNTIYSIIEKHANTQPEKTALIGIKRRPLSYQGLIKQIDYIGYILQQHVVNPKAPVSVVLPNGPEMAVSFLGVASNAICAPLNPNYRVEEYTYFLSDLKPKALITLSGTHNQAIDVANNLGIEIIYLSPSKKNAGVFTLDNIEVNNERLVDNVSPSSQDTALILHTSGTTSRPKMVPLSHGNLCKSAENIKNTLKLTNEDCCLNVMPLFHIHGLIGALLASISAGSSIICTPNYSSTEFFNWVSHFKPSWYSAVPTIHQSVLERSKHHSKITSNHSIRFIRSSSSALPPKVMDGLEAIFDVPVIESYGMTEASHQMSSNQLPPGTRKKKSVGLPSGPEMAIMDAEGNLLKQGEVGEVVIKGPNVTTGYLNNKEANNTSFIRGWFRTGDEGYFDEDNYLFLTDRIKEIINRGGEKISPREVDELVLDYPGVQQALTFAVPDTRLGEEIAVAIVPKEGVDISPWDIQKHVASRLIDFKVPRHVIFLKEIPKGPTGKLQRIGLADKLSIEPINELQTSSTSEYKAPTTTLEKSLVKIWSEVLKVTVGIRDNYFQLGGDSLKAEEIVTQTSKLLEIDRIPLVIFLHAPNIEKMAMLLQEDLGREEQVLINLQKNGLKNPLYLIHACAGEVLFFADLVNYLRPDRPIYALRSPGLDRGEINYNSVEELASIYIESMLENQKEGPYIIGGAGIGGIIGMEMSHMLTDLEKNVSALILFDTVPPRKRETSHRRSFLDKIIFILSRIKFYIVNGQFKQMAIAMIKKRYQQITAPNDIQLKILKHNIEIASKYNIRKFNDQVILFMSEKRLGFPKDPMYRINMWSELLPETTEKIVNPGEHLNIFKEPYVRTLAQKLTEYLDQRKL